MQQPTINIDEQLQTLKNEYNSNIKAKRKSKKRLKQLRREMNEETEKVELLSLFLKAQIPLSILIGGVSILAGGVQIGLIGWGVLAAIQSISSIAASTVKNKKKEHIEDLEDDIFNEEDKIESYNTRAKNCLTKAKYLMNPGLREEEIRKEQEELNKYTIFKIIDGKAIEVKKPEKPREYIKTPQKTS